MEEGGGKVKGFDDGDQETQRDQKSARGWSLA